jgi:tRNA(fMet)-specific endonuclease VapC
VTHLLDTNTCVVYLRQTSAGAHVAARLARAAPGTVVLCSVVIAELLFGAYRSKQVVKNLQQTTAFCGRFVSHPFDDIAADEYGRVRADLEGKTHNTAEFSRVPGLKIEDWQVP